MTDHPLVGRTVVIGRNRQALTLQTRVHEYPGKRVIFRGQLDDGTCVAAKFYFGFPRQAWEWLRGLRGARLLQASALPAPRLLYAGYCRDVSAWLTVLEWIDADETWPPSTELLERTDHRRLIGAIAEHHAAGIVQNDMNLQNFVPQSGRLHTVDTDRLRRYSAPLGRRPTLAHLVRIYASKSRIPEDELRWAYQRYCADRGWPHDGAEENALLARIRHARMAQAWKVARRAAHGWKHYGRAPADEYQLFFDRRRVSRDALVRLANALRESGNVETVPLAEILPGYALRRVIKPGASSQDPTRPLDQSSRGATRTWIKILALQRLGFPVPRTAGLIHDRKKRLAWLISEPSDTALPLDTLRNTQTDDRDRAIAALGKFLEHMHDYRIGNRDASPGTLVWDGERIWLLDVGNIRFDPWYLPGFERRWRRETDQLLNRLAVSLQTSAETLRLRLNPRAP